MNTARKMDGAPVIVLNSTALLEWARKFCYDNVSRGLYLLFLEAYCVNMCGNIWKRADLGGSSN